MAALFMIETKEYFFCELAYWLLIAHKKRCYDTIMSNGLVEEKLHEPNNKWP